MPITQRFRREATPLFVLGVLVLSSCGSREGRKPVFPVKGQVFHKGKAAVGAVLVFHPKTAADPAGPRPHARVGADGAFTLTTYQAQDGAPAGDYVVTIDWRQGAAHGKAPGGWSPLPTEYSSPDASPLRATIREGSNDLPPFAIE